jgi:hypothetical protein
VLLVECHGLYDTSWQKYLSSEAPAHGVLIYLVNGTIMNRGFEFLRDINMTIPIERGVITSLDTLDPTVVADNPEFLLLLQKARKNFQNWETVEDGTLPAESKALAEETAKKIGGIVSSAAAVLTPEAEISLGRSTLSMDENTILAVSMTLASDPYSSNR